MARTKVLHAIPDLCTGCRICELVCSSEKTGIANPSLARLKVRSNREEAHFTPIICRHCKNPACYAACPVKGAMSLDGDGTVTINQGKCTACLACADACPFGAIQLGPNVEVLKCDLCGGDPKCAKYCPVRPANQTRHLPYPASAALEWVEPYRITRKLPVEKKVQE